MREDWCVGVLRSSPAAAWANKQGHHLTILCPNCCRDDNANFRDGKIRRRGGGALQEFGKPDPKTVLLQAQSASRRTNSFQLCADSAASPPPPPSPLASTWTNMRSALQPPSPPTSQQPRAACHALHPPPHASKQPLTLHAAACYRPQHAVQKRGAQVQVDGGAGPQLVNGIRPCWNDSTRQLW